MIPLTLLKLHAQICQSVMITLNNPHNTETSPTTLPIDNSQNMDTLIIVKENIANTQEYNSPLSMLPPYNGILFHHSRRAFLFGGMND